MASDMDAVVLGAVVAAGVLEERAMPSEEEEQAMLLVPVLAAGKEVVQSSWDNLPSCGPWNHILDMLL